MSQKNKPPNIHVCSCRACREDKWDPKVRLHKTLNRLLSATDERSRRHFAVYLVLDHENRHGGYKTGGVLLTVNKMTGLSPHTLRTGLHEITDPKLELSADRVRRPGGGRKSKAANGMKYTCPACQTNAWAKPQTNLICGDCNEPMEPEQPDQKEV
jgi:hypothetical protein